MTPSNDGKGKKVKPIKDMTSREFIAHLFYNVLGGLYAMDEIAARLAILEIIEGLQAKEVKPRKKKK